MRSRTCLRVIAVAVLTAFALVPHMWAKEPRQHLQENAYYEFRGRVTDRNTMENTFTLVWNTGSQIIAITSNTKVFRYGQMEKLDSVKAGDAARGFGQAQKGTLVASAVAFGAEGVELPGNVKIPTSIILPPRPAVAP